MKALTKRILGCAALTCQAASPGPGPGRCRGRAVFFVPGPPLQSTPTPPALHLRGNEWRSTSRPPLPVPELPIDRSISCQVRTNRSSHHVENDGESVACGRAGRGSCWLQFSPEKGPAETTAANAGRVVDDSVITGQVKAALVADPTTKAHQINVETFKGEVQLTGFVDTTEARSRAVEIARTSMA